MNTAALLVCMTLQTRSCSVVTLQTTSQPDNSDSSNLSALLVRRPTRHHDSSRRVGLLLGLRDAGHAPYGAQSGCLVVMPGVRRR